MDVGMYLRVVTMSDQSLLYDAAQGITTDVNVEFQVLVPQPRVRGGTTLCTHEMHVQGGQMSNGVGASLPKDLHSQLSASRVQTRHIRPARHCATHHPWRPTACRNAAPLMRPARHMPGNTRRTGEPYVALAPATTRLYRNICAARQQRR